MTTCHEMVQLADVSLACNVRGLLGHRSGNLIVCCGRFSDWLRSCCTAAR